MSHHKSEDYKMSVVKYYLRSNKTQEEACEIFSCSPRSLMRWVERYRKYKEIRRHNREAIAYKVTKEHVKYMLKLVKENRVVASNTIS